MGKDYRMPRGRLTPAGVPSSLLDGHTGHRKDNIRSFGKILQDKRDKEDILKKLRRCELSPWQKKAGARRII